MKTAIAKPGIYSIPMRIYHSQKCCVGPSASSSGLCTIFTESPAHFYETSDLNPEASPDDEDESESFILGRAAHHLFLGEDDFRSEYIMRPDELDGKPWQGNRIACREWIAEQERENRTVLKPTQIQAIRRMARSLAAHPLVAAGILNGAIEQSLVWKDKDTGIWLKARPDAIPNDSGDFADLKTTRVYGDKLDASVSNYRYDMQAALIKWGCKEVLKRDLQSFSFVFVGTKPPYCTEVLQLDPTDIEAAEKDLRCAVRTFAACLASGNWFGPGGSQQDSRWCRISEWARKGADYRRELLEREISGPQSAPLQGVG